MTKFSKLEKNFELSSEKNLELNSTSREAVIAVESRDHFKNGVSLKDHRSRKNFLILVCFSLLVVFSGCNKENSGNDGNGGTGNVNILDKNVESNKLTSTLCIKLVREHWDCSMGATYYTGQYWYQYGCKDGDRGKVTSTINDFFAGGINTEESYYRDYILFLKCGSAHLLVLF
jgi:hypothetical protein